MDTAEILHRDRGLSRTVSCIC